MRLSLFLFFGSALIVVLEILQFNFLSTAGMDEYKFGRTACLVVSTTAWCTAICLNVIGFFFALRNLIANGRHIGLMITLVCNSLAILLIAFSLVKSVLGEP